MSLVLAQRRRVADLLISERKSRGWSQKRFAAELEVNQPTLCGWETAQRLPSPEWQERLAKYFGISPQQLLFGESTGAA